MPRVIKIYFLWAIIIASISIAAFQLLSVKDSTAGRISYREAIANWDADRYLRIAKNGYTDDSQYAFFPLYPLLIKIFSLNIYYLQSAIVLSIIFSMSGFWILFQYLRNEFNENLAEKTIILTLLFPTSFYFLLPYAESLFLLLTALTFYFAQKKKWLKAAIFAGLITATRPVGVAVSIAFLVIYLKSNKYRLSPNVIVIAFSGIILYCTYLFLQTGYPFYFLVSQLDWNRQISLPFSGYLTGVEEIVYSQTINRGFNTFINFVFAIFGLGMGIRTLRFLKRELSVYSLVSIAIPLITPTLISIPRFLVVNFPIFVLIAKLKSNRILIAYTITSVILLTLNLVLFINGFWVS